MAAASGGVVLRQVWGALGALGVVAAHLALAPAAAADEHPLAVDFDPVDPVVAGAPVEIGFGVHNTLDPDEDLVVGDIAVHLACSKPGCGELAATFDREELGPDEHARGVIDGRTPDIAGELELTLTVGYVVDEERFGEVSESTTLTLTPPDPPDPTRSPGPGPTLSPDPPEPPEPPNTPDPSQSVAPSETPPPSQVPDPVPSPTAGGSDRSSPAPNAAVPAAGSGSGGSGHGAGTSGPAPATPGAPGGDGAEGFATDPLDLPSADTPADDLPELPLVTPDGDDEAEEDGAGLATEAAPLRGATAPGVLLLTLLLLLLLATPLAPARRVRAGVPYRGRRRKGW